MAIKKQDERNIKEFISSVVHNELPELDEGIAYSFISKAFLSGCYESTNHDDINLWYRNNFLKNLFILDEDDYVQASIQALKIQFNMAATDFGTSRQRDLGQKWSDTIRGYLGEIGVKKLLKKRWNIEANLGHEPGSLKEYLPTDIHSIKTDKDSDFRKTNLKISIKTTKANGIWFDITGDQFHHSDIYILALIGIETDHLFSFFKHISVFKDKILKKGIDHNVINASEAQDIYDRVPTFKKIYGYIPGLIASDDKYDKYSYKGYGGRTNYTIFNWSGKYEPDYLEQVKQVEGFKTVSFEGIKQFSYSNRYIFGLASLENSDLSWAQKFVDKL